MCLGGRHLRLGRQVPQHLGAGGAYQGLKNPHPDLNGLDSLIPPQANRAVSAAKQADPFLAARVKEETDAGIVIRGCRMLATLPISDEIMVFPSTVLKNPEEDAPYAFGFSIPNNTPGLRFICRESVDYGRSHFDHPLGSRFEEMDAVVILSATRCREWLVSGVGIRRRGILPDAVARWKWEIVFLKTNIETTCGRKMPCFQRVLRDMRLTCESGVDMRHVL